MAVRLLANMVNVGRAFWAWGSLWLPQPRIECLSLVPADLLHLIFHNPPLIFNIPAVLEHI